MQTNFEIFIFQFLNYSLTLINRLNKLKKNFHQHPPEVYKETLLGLEMKPFEEIKWDQAIEETAASRL